MKMSMLIAVSTVCMIPACDTATGPDTVWDVDPARFGRLSSDFVKTILAEDSTLFTWGPGFEGTLGLGDLAWHDTPQRIPGLKRVVSYMQGGVGTAFALDSNGDLYFWGNNSLYLEEPGLGTIVMVPTRVAHLEGAGSISYGVAGATYFIREDGSLGPVFRDPNTPTATLIPEDVVVPNRVLQVSSSLGLYSDGTVFSLYESAPGYGGLIPGLDGVAAVQNVFNRRTVYLSQDGTVWAWGQNGCGQLGDGSYESRSTPVRVATCRA